MGSNPTGPTFMQFKDDFKKQLTIYILSAFGMVTGLAWNEAIKSVIDYIFPFAQSGGLILKTIYALALTVTVVIVTAYLNRNNDE